MKKISYLLFFVFISLSLTGQTVQQPSGTTATIKKSTRLFSAKDDLTTVIMMIPADSVADVIDTDSTYMHVVYDDTEGYIFRKHAVLNPTVSGAQATVNGSTVQDNNGRGQSRFSYLENKYGTSMAARLSAGKIWKGMNSEMVKDSWGVAEKVNRVINGNTIREEWIYRNTWLFFENNSLVEWGPVKR